MSQADVNVTMGPYEESFETKTGEKDRYSDLTFWLACGMGLIVAVICALVAYVHQRYHIFLSGVWLSKGLVIHKKLICCRKSKIKSNSQKKFIKINKISRVVAD